MKYIIIFVILLSSLYGKKKDCFFNKYLDERTCYYKFFDRKSLHKPKFGEKYYQTPNGSVYALNGEIEIKFKAIGAVLTLMEDFEIDFIDKKKGEKFIFKVKDNRELFIILRKINDLTAIQKAVPVRKRMFSKAAVAARLARIKEKKDEDLDKFQSEAEAKKEKQKKMGSGGFQGGNFLKGGAK